MEKICPFSLANGGYRECFGEQCMAWGRVNKVKHTEVGVYDNPVYGCKLIEKNKD